MTTPAGPLAALGASGATGNGRRRLLSGWGRTSPTAAHVASPASVEAVAELLAVAGPRGVVARGLGRSYGDAAQNAGGTVIDMTALSAVRDVDVAAGEVTVEAGASLDALISLMLPLGWFPRVVPGTRYVTVGGAVASDIHGKNQHVEGSFGDHVAWLELVTAGGERIVCGPDQQPEVFDATTGGMGLTGVVTAARLRFSPVPSSWLCVDTERANDLDDALARMAADDDDHRYAMAWIDCVARGERLGRSVLFRGDFAHRELLAARQRDAPLAPPRAPRLTAPPWAPNGLLRRSTVSAFNELYFRRWPRGGRRRVEPIEPFFFPLDVVRGWNVLYGPRGFLQYQLVVPFGAEDALRTALERLSAAGCASFLAVLKRFGRERGLISFPMPGWTLSLDIPASAGDVLTSLLDGLDEVVAAAGGRVYLSKDSRLRPELLSTMYPRLEEWEAVRARLDPEGQMRSDLARRLGIGGAVSEPAG